ncbi:hypothetical protein ABBQ38_014355 [Trebouxia sp. C0009 RCD-2024]
MYFAGQEFDEQYVQHLAAEAQQLGHEGMKTAVAAALRKQVVSVSTALHTTLAGASDPVPAALHALLADLQQRQHAALAAAPKTQRPRGLAAAMGVADPQANRAAAAALLHGTVPTPQPPAQADPTPASTPLATPSCSPSVSSSNSSEISPPLSSSESDDETASGTTRKRMPCDNPLSRNSSNIHQLEPPSSSSSSSSNASTVGTGTAASQDSSASVGTAGGAGLSMADLAAALHQRLGYSLTVQPSGIAHPDAGDGLFLQGGAPVGAVVALYPGLVYEPMHYRQIPGFPKIDANNDYFLARFDGALIDGQSWGRGRQTLSKQQPVDMGSNPHNSSRQASLAELYQKELRHPLALAHYANHPAAGSQANVMVAAFDVTLKLGKSPNSCCSHPSLHQPADVVHLCKHTNQCVCACRMQSATLALHLLLCHCVHVLRINKRY